MSRSAWIVLVAVALAGCEGSKVETKSTSSSSRASSTPATQANSEAEVDTSKYAENASARLKVFVESLMDLTGGTGDLSATIPSSDGEAQAAITKSVQQMRDNVRKKGEAIKDLTPPEELKPFHVAMITLVNDANTRWDQAVERAESGDMQAGIRAVEDMARLIEKHSPAIDDGVAKAGYDADAFHANLTLVKKG